MVLEISLILLFVLVFCFAWLAQRARRAQRPLIKWPGTIAAGLLALFCVLVSVLALVGVYRVYRPHRTPVADITVDASPEAVARGERLAYLCVDCHAPAGELPLRGTDVDITAGALGVLQPPNLTPGGPLREWTDGEIARAIRQGVHRDGRALLLMPSDQYRVMSDADVAALVAYLRAQPAIEHPTPETRLNLLGAVVVGLGLFPLSAQPPLDGPVADPPLGVTSAHGAYLVELAGCRECHGEALQGGTSQFVPKGPALPALVSQWSVDEFVQTLRTGVDPYGNTLNPETMPWPSYDKAFDDEKLAAMHAYLTSLAAVSPAP